MEDPGKAVPPADMENAAIEEFSDRSLNYYSDQVPDIKPQLRQLNLEYGLKTALQKIKFHSAALMLGGALGFLWRRNFTVASFLVAGFLLRQALKERRAAVRPLRRRAVRERTEMELERYALKAQRGDFGKLEVIPFK